MVTGVARTTTRGQQPTADAETDGETSYRNHSRRSNSSWAPELVEQYNHIQDAITTLPSSIQVHNANKTMLHKKVSTFNNNKDVPTEIEHPLKHHSRLCSKKITEQNDFQSLLREEFIENSNH